MSPVRNNISLTVVRLLSRLGIINRVAERNTVSKAVGQLDMKVTSVKQSAQTLSGGNQQKVVLAKWLARQSGLLILCEPTRGIDIGTKVEMQRKIRELAREGLTIIVVSSEIEEILAISDRVLVMYEGLIRNELAGPNLLKDVLVSSMYSADAPNRKIRALTNIDSPSMAKPRKVSSMRRFLKMVFAYRNTSLVLFLVIIWVVLASVAPTFSGPTMSCWFSGSRRPSASWALA